MSSQPTQPSGREEEKAVKSFDLPPIDEATHRVRDIGEDAEAVTRRPRGGKGGMVEVDKRCPVSCRSTCR